MKRDRSSLSLLKNGRLKLLTILGQSSAAFCDKSSRRSFLKLLVEAGVRVVTLSYSFWDWHGNNFKIAKQNFPDFDQALSALIEDLDQRGMLEDTTVIAWGEFGRTPKINKDAGRDHWPNVSCAVLAGGGMRAGQVIGATDRLGGEVTSRPVTFQEVFVPMHGGPR